MDIDGEDDTRRKDSTRMVKEVKMRKTFRTKDNESVDLR